MSHLRTHRNRLPGSNPRWLRRPATRLWASRRVPLEGPEPIRERQGAQQEGGWPKQAKWKESLSVGVAKLGESATVSLSQDARLRIDKVSASQPLVSPFSRRVIESEGTYPRSTRLGPSPSSVAYCFILLNLKAPTRVPPQVGAGIIHPSGTAQALDSVPDVPFCGKRLWPSTGTLPFRVTARPELWPDRCLPPVPNRDTTLILKQSSGLPFSLLFCLLQELVLLLDNRADQVDQFVVRF